MSSIKSCKIIYGYKENCLDDCQDSPVLLIEPRSNYIDKIRKLNLPITLVSKVLVKQTTTQETLMHYDKENSRYWLRNKNDNLIVNGTNLFNIKRYQVYTTNIESILLQYKIQNVKSFQININIENCNDLLESITPYNHIFSHIIIDKCVKYFNKSSKILSNFYSNQEQKYTQEQKDTQEQTKDNSVLCFSHKNLNIELPKIAMYFLNEPCNKDTLQELTFLVNQYKMNIIINKHENQCKQKVIIPYPESVKILGKNEISSRVSLSKIYHENIIQNLESIFYKRIEDDNEIKVNDLEIVIQFNQKYFSSKKTLQIMYPLKDNTIYVNKMYDIMYATKNCMYMLYQILKSTYFSNYIESKKQEKPIMFKIFSKRYFYEYIEKIFIITEF
jgi:hypothetical protein